MNGVLLVLTLRFAKFLAITLFLSGLAATFAGESLATRKKVIGRVLAPGFLLTWTLGFALAFATGSPLLTPFVLYTLLASFVALQAALFYGLGEGRSRGAPLVVCAASVAASFFFMVFRHSL
jgi:hypothetical protein